MKSVYIASPYSIGDKLTNVRRQIDAYKQLREKGFIPYAPLLDHYINEVYPEMMTYEQWLEVDLYWLKKCDFVCRLPGDSHGADIECAVARLEGIPVCTLEELVWEDNNGVQ